MPPTIISKKASNWVDRGESPNATLRRVLAHFFGRLAQNDQAWLEEQANTIFGMVAADATEIHVAGYLRSVVRESGIEVRQPLGARQAAISVWHIAKAAQVRDFAERVISGEIPANVPTPAPLSEWLAGRLLSPDELAEYERDEMD